MSKFKTKEEYEEEDSISYRRRLENLQKRRDLRRAEGFKCKSEGCGQNFETKLEFEADIKMHQDEFRKAMKCSKDQCKDIKVRFLRLFSLLNEYVLVFSSEAEESITSTLRNTSRRP